MKKQKMNQEEVIAFLMAARVPDEIADKLLEEAGEAERKRDEKNSKKTKTN